MKKVKFRKLISLVIGATMLVPAIGASAVENVGQVKKYVALGDSISYGMSAEKGKGYVELFYNNLMSIDNNMTLKNLSVPGETSSDLLKIIETKGQEIENADVVTISIGGNNFLRPTIIAVSEALGIGPEPIDLAQEIKRKVSINPKEAKNRLDAIKDNKKYIGELGQGANQLVKDFPQVIALVKKAAPKAKVYINNLYNPFSKSNSFYSIYDGICIEMNRQLAGVVAQNRGSGCEIIDVYSLFKDRTDYVNFDLATIKIDPHPSTEGHYAIAQKLVYAFRNDGSETEKTDGQIYKMAYDATMKALETKAQKDINEARKLLVNMPQQLEWAKGELSAKLDKAQNEIISKFIVAIENYRTTKSKEDMEKAKDLLLSLMTVEYNEGVKAWIDNIIKQFM